MDGTHNPMKIPASFSPLNHRYSENIKDRNADKSISKSVGVNFFSIVLIFVKLLEFTINIWFNKIECP